MSSSRTDFFDPERLRKLWGSGPETATPEVAAAPESSLSTAEEAAALLARLRRALERDFGAGVARYQPFLERAGNLCAQLPDPVAGAQLSSLLNGLEDLMETIGVGAKPGELPRG